MEAKQYIGEGWKHAILIIGAIVVMLPFYMMVSMSLKSQQEIQSISGGLIGAQETQTFPVCVKTGYSEETCTMKPYQYNYWFAFEKAPIPRYLMNGVIVTLSIISPPPMKGSILSNNLYLPQRTPLPVGPNILCPEKA